MRTPYLELGQAIAQGRSAAGLANQRDLASRLDTTQQSVSRWEAGTHRPKLEQIADLAAVLMLNTGDLALLARYAPVPSAVTVRPFPVEHLDPTTFEYFVADLAQRLWPDAQVRRAGSKGHKQDGVDVNVILSDGTTIGLQCKRAAQFGPREARRAIEALTANVDRKVIALSRVASPQTAALICGTPGWEIWDIDDISRRIRRLPEYDQEKLVDLYWPGQRRALLGRSEPGPWLKPEEFFRPFEDKELPFSHAWELQGREDELNKLLTSLRVGDRLTLLSGPGGMGKSRLLKTIAEYIGCEEPASRVVFLSTTGIPTAQSLDHLGPGPKILIVDDAHDRDGLGLLFDFVADPARQARLVLATRPYAKDRILGEAAVHGVAIPAFVDLKPLSKRMLEGLAENVLSEFGAPAEWADPIIESSGNSPLFIAMASRIIARDRTSPESVRAHDDLRNYIRGKFDDVMSGAFAAHGEGRVHRAVLEVLAIVQPFNLENAQLRDLIASVQTLGADDVSRALKALVDGGIAICRGPSCRLTPDMLGDILIERACLTAGGRLSPFALEVLDTLPASLLKNALINLGRLDWRLSEGDTSNSSLLSAVWQSFDEIENDWDLRLDAIKAAALYQPSQALEFIRRLARRGLRLSAFDDIARNIAYSGSRFEEVLSLLWGLTRLGGSPEGRRGTNAAKVLADLGEINQRNPPWFARRVTEFGLNLSKDARNWDVQPTPLTLLRPVMEVEGVHAEGVGHGVALSPFFINYEAVRPLREMVINRAMEMLHHDDPRIAADAGSFFGVALRGPFGAMSSVPPDDLGKSLEGEFIQTLVNLAQALRCGIHPLAAFGIAQSVDWHAQHGSDSTRAAAKRVMAALPTDTRFRTLSALADGWGHTFVPIVQTENWQAEIEVWRKSVVQAIEGECPEPKARLAYMEARIEELVGANIATNTAHTLIWSLAQSDVRFARTMLEHVLVQADSYLRPFASAGLTILVQNAPDEGLQMANRLIATQDEDLAAAVASACAAFGPTPGPDEMEVVRTLISSRYPFVVSRAIDATIHWTGLSFRDRIDLLLTANVAGQAKVADDLAMTLVADRPGAYDAAGKWGQVRPGEIDLLLALFEPIPELNGHWIDELLAVLSYRFPDETADFFMRRAERAAIDDDYEFRPANFGHYSQKRLRFIETPEGASSIARVWRWLERNPDRGPAFDAAAQTLFDAMVAFDNNALATFLGPLVPAADAACLRQMGKVLRRARPEFVFKQTPFVLDYLRRCQTVNPQMLEVAIGQLFAGAISGVRTGQSGQPMPRDLEYAAKSDEILASLSPIDPAYDLFAEIRTAAQRDIDEAIEAAALIREDDG